MQKKKAGGLPRPAVVYNPEQGHGGFLLDEATQSTIIAAALALAQPAAVAPGVAAAAAAGSFVAFPAGPAAARRLLLAAEELAAQGVAAAAAAATALASASVAPSDADAEGGRLQAEPLFVLAPQAPLRGSGGNAIMSKGRWWRGGVAAATAGAQQLQRPMAAAAAASRPWPEPAPRTAPAPTRLSRVCRGYAGAYWFCQAAGLEAPPCAVARAAVRGAAERISAHLRQQRRSPVSAAGGCARLL